MSYSKRESLSAEYLAPKLFSPEYHVASSAVGMPSLSVSRSTSPSSIQTSSISISRTVSETQRDSMDSSTSRSTTDGSQYAPSPMRQGSNDSCDEHPCSRCRLSEEEHRRIKAERRKEQNRASQRRFRAKKENEIRGAADQVATLESMIQDLEKRNMDLSQTNVALMARLAELESQQPYNFRSEDHSGNTQCQHCHKVISLNPSTDVIDYFWPVDHIENQHSSQVGTYIPVFDYEAIPFEA